MMSSTTWLLAVAVSAAYAFSRFRFRGRTVLMLQFLLINMFPVVLLILPLLAPQFRFFTTPTTTIFLSLATCRNELNHPHYLHFLQKSSCFRL